MAWLGKFRGDTDENWRKYNPILADREFILVKADVGSPWRFVKFGDGLKPYTELPLLPLVPADEGIFLDKDAVFLTKENNYKETVQVFTKKEWQVS